MKTRTRILVRILYLFYLAALLEVGCRVLLALPGPPIWSETDAAWRGQWIRRHGGRPEIYYNIHVYDPVRGWATKPDLELVSQWGLKGVRFMEDKFVSSNSAGFRGRREYSLLRDTAQTRVLLLGDSFTFGDEVSDDETFAHYLQKLAPSIEVINAGVSGYGHDQMLLTLREFGSSYRPDIVVLGFIENDMNRNRLGFRDYAKPKFVIANDSLVLQGTPVPRPAAVLNWNWLWPRTLEVASTIAWKIRMATGSEQRAVEEITSRLLAETARVSESIGARMVFLYLPIGSEISTDTAKTPGEVYLDGWCTTRTDVECVTARPCFAAGIANRVQYKQTGHWGPAGHRTVATALYNYLIAPDDGGADRLADTDTCPQTLGGVRRPGRDVPDS